jgi:hypothetical protein
MGVYCGSSGPFEISHSGPALKHILVVAGAQLLVVALLLKSLVIMVVALLLKSLMIMAMALLSKSLTAALSWFTHQPDTWEIIAPDWSMVQHDTEANVWQAKRQKLLDLEVNKRLCKGWVD